MTTTIDEDVTEDQDVDLAELIPTDIAEEVMALLAEEVPPYDDNPAQTDEQFAQHLLEIWGAHLDESDKVDHVGYADDLEALAYRFYRQRNFLLMAISNNFNKSKMYPAGMWKTHEVVNKFIIYSATGLDLSVVGAPRKIYTRDQFESLLVAFDYLPDEWKPRGAHFIQIYSSNFFQTEFATG